MMSDEETVMPTFYAIQNLKGEWYMTSSSWRNKWRETLAEARIYANASQARSQITRIANRKRDEAVPLLVEFYATTSKVVNQEERVARSRAEAAAKKEKLRQARAKHLLDLAERRLLDAQDNLASLRR